MPTMRRFRIMVSPGSSSSPCRSSTSGRPSAAKRMKRSSVHGAMTPSDLRESVHWKADSTRFVASVFAYRGLDYQGRKAGLLTIIDITERRRHEAEIQQLAHQDPLTGLPNRLMFNKCLDDAFAGRQRLRGIADRSRQLQGCQRYSGPSDRRRPHRRRSRKAQAEHPRARFRGAPWRRRIRRHPECPSRRAGDIETLALRLIASITEPFDINGHRLSIGLSAGITRAPHDGPRRPDRCCRTPTSLSIAPRRWAAASSVISCRRCSFG